MHYDLVYSKIQSVNFVLGTSILKFRKPELDFICDQVRDIEGKILDYGCNDGKITNLIKKSSPGSEVCGADINVRAISHAKIKNPYIEFYHVEDEFIQNNKFDAIVVSHVLEHIRDRDSFIKNIKNILSPRGKLIIVVPQEKIRGQATPLQILYNCLKLNFENPHVAKLNYKDVESLLQKYGFSVEDSMYTNFFAPATSDTRKLYSFSLALTAINLDNHLV